MYLLLRVCVLLCFFLCVYEYVYIYTHLIRQSEIEEGLVLKHSLFAHRLFFFKKKITHY